MESLQAFPVSFGELLKTFRKRKRLTQKQLAQHLSVHANTISSWELGTYLPATSGLVLELARLLYLNDLETRQLLESSLTALSPYWYVPFQRNPLFTGREEILEILHARLQVEQASALTQSYALQGLAGIGKTQIALEYAYRHSLEYSAVFWIEAETVESIVSSMLHIAELLQLPELLETDQKRIGAAVQNWLSTHSRWLLILDNLEDLELLSCCLPSARQGAILITTRFQALGTLALGLELSPMNQEEGMMFLLRRAKLLEPEALDERVLQLAEQQSHEYAAAQKLVMVMDGLPLALDQAGAYIEETGCSLSSYLLSFEEQCSQLLDRRGASGVDHPHSVMATLKLACERSAQLNPKALDLLHFCAFVSPDAIPEGLLLQDVSCSELLLEPIANDQVQLDQAIAALRSLSLIQRHPETQSLSLHLLVQTVLRELMSEQERAKWLSRVPAVLNMAFPEATYEAWEQCERLLPHVLAFAVATPSQNENRDYAEVLRKAADYLCKRDRYDQAKLMYERTLRIWKQSGELKHPEAIRSLNGLGRICFARAQFDQSEAFFQRALDMGQEALGSNTLEVAQALNGLGITYEMRGNYEQAEPLLKQAMHICKQVGGLEHLDLAASFNNLAMLYTKQGKEEQAEELYQQALHIDEQALGPEHPDVAYPLYALAKLYVEQGRYAEAEPLYQRALHIWEHVWGAQHPEVANALQHLAELNVRQGKREQAVSHIERACDIFEQHLGRTHPESVKARSFYLSLLNDKVESVLE